MREQGRKDPGRRQRRKQETRRQIFQAAMNLFARKGIFSTTVEEITEAADVGKGTFFNYFPSKEAILSALAERQLEIIDRAAEKAASAVTVRPVLQEMVRELLSGPARSPIMLRSLFATVLSNQMLLGLFSRALQAGREKVATIIERGQQIGEVRRDIPAIEIARCLQQTAFGTSFIWAASQPSDLIAWQERSMGLFWRGIATHSESGSGPLNSKQETAAPHES
ncbi:MAG TPA: TetR/AcrR family transcriptional regulator [Candidatus Angelobacter sp.]|nr:TetR/AcrR family transcriptional regulator [Candidatus Angelobacter sp.]